MKLIHYSPERVATLVKFALFGDKPHIKQATGESLRTLRAVAVGRRVPPPSVLTYFELQQNGKDSYTWRPL